MSVSKIKGSPFYYTRFSINGIRVQETTKATTRAEALRYEEKRRQDIRNELVYGQKIKIQWYYAQKRWLEEMQHKRTILQDAAKFEFLDKHLGHLYLDGINKDIIREIIQTLQKTGVKSSTINRYLALIKSILNRAYKDWEWLDKVPYIRLLPENPKEGRDLTPEEETRLFENLPIDKKSQLIWVTEFALATGRRTKNILWTKWTDVDMEQKTHTVPKEANKTNKTHTIPLNKRAMNVLYSLKGRDPVYVFGKGNGIRPYGQCSTKAWYKALNKAGIKDFKFHNTRHTWASNHARRGTPQIKTTRLGGWSTTRIMERHYQKLRLDDLRDDAENILEE